MKDLITNTKIRCLSIFMILAFIISGCAYSGAPYDQTDAQESFYRIGIYGVNQQQALYDQTGVFAFFNNFFLSSKEYQSLDKYLQYPSRSALKNDFNHGVIDIAIIYNLSAKAQKRLPVTIFVNPVTLSDSDKIFISDSMEYMGLGTGVYISYWNNK